MKCGRTDPRLSRESRKTEYKPLHGRQRQSLFGGKIQKGTIARREGEKKEGTFSSLQPISFNERKKKQSLTGKASHSYTPHRGGKIAHRKERGNNKRCLSGQGWKSREA